MTNFFSPGQKLGGYIRLSTAGRGELAANSLVGWNPKRTGS